MASDERYSGVAASIPSYFPALDGLRLICCGMVIIGHSLKDHPLRSYAAEMASMGVNIFFSLSGFLITKLLLDELKATGRVRLGAFYMRRTLRIWPVYYVAILTTAALLLAFRARFARVFGIEADVSVVRMVAAYGTFLGNWIHVRVPTTIDVLWSVCVEEQFYLLFPITFVFRARRHPAFVPIAIGLLIAWCTRLALALAHVPASTIMANPFAHGDHLLLGALLAQCVHAAPGTVSHAARTAAKHGGELVLLAAISALLYWQMDRALSPAEWFGSLLVSALLSAGLVAIIGFGGGPLARTLARPSAVALGRLTYAGYVFHMFAVAVSIWVVRRLPITVAWGAPLRLVVGIPLTFAIAYVVRITFEARFLRLKSRFEQVHTTATLASGKTS